VTNGARYVHLSVDYTFQSLFDLAVMRGSSLAYHPTLGFLHRLHERFGACITLYVFQEVNGRSLWELPASLMDLFAETPWLRLAFHATSKATHAPGCRLAPDRVARAVQETHEAIARFAGPAAVDATFRLHRFAGPRAALTPDPAEGWRVILTPDDDRTEVYDMTPRERNLLAAQTEFFDEVHRLAFLPSLRRFECDAQPERTIEAWWARMDERQPQLPVACVFTHEQHLSDPVVQDRIERAMMTATAAGARPVFPSSLVRRERGDHA